MAADKEIDAVTGVETTGHDWDGIKELNKPLPKWWLYTFYACIVWSVGYWIAYPAWPRLGGYTRGVLGYSQRATVTAEIDKARAAQGDLRKQIATVPLDGIKQNQDLLRFAMAGGAAAFATNCAPCHGRSAQGAKGYPNLSDDDWLWGGTLADIQATIENGIRSGEKKERRSDMPKYGIENLLKPEEIDDAAEFVLSLSGRSTDAAAVEKGRKTFAEQCAACHGADGKGKLDMGAPNLTDPIWLYGGSKPEIMESISTGRGGVMPAWAGRLDPVTIKELAVYVHALGGGK